MFLVISSCFCPLIFLPFSPDTLVPRMGVGMGEGEGQGSKTPQREACLSMAYARIGRGSSPLGQATSPSPLPQPLPPGILPGNWASLLFCC